MATDPGQIRHDAERPDRTVTDPVRRPVSSGGTRLHRVQGQRHAGQHPDRHVLRFLVLPGPGPHALPIIRAHRFAHLDRTGHDRRHLLRRRPFLPGRKEGSRTDPDRRPMRDHPDALAVQAHRYHWQNRERHSRLRLDS